MNKVLKRIALSVMTASVLPLSGIAALAADGTVTAETAVLEVDVSERIGDITHGAGGFLYGIADEGVPTTNTMVPLKPKVLCTGTMLTTEHPYGDTEFVAEQFLEAGGEQVMMYLPNYYGYALGVSADYREYAKVMRDRIVPHVVEWKENWKKKHGVTDGNPDELAQRIDIDKAIIYLPVNEGAPRNGTDDFGKAWLEYCNAIRSVDPNATIGGTNDWSYNSAFGTHPTENRNYELRDFLPFCIKNDCMPDIFTWHELDEYDMRDMQAHKEHFENAWETAYTDAGFPVPELPQIVINEYATMDDCGVPGRLVNWIARFEECGFYACLPFWHQANSLNDLASDANEGSAAWWTYKWYGDMSGELLKVESSTDYDELYGLASIDDNKRSVKALFGGRDGAASVQFENVDAADAFKDAEKVHIKVEASDYAGMTGTQFEPDTVLEGNFPINSDGSVILNLDNMKFSSSFHVTMTAAADDADTETVYTAPYIGYYEAEQALAEDGAEVCNRYVGGEHWGASSYISDDSLVYTRKNGSKLTYTVTVPTDGRYELNFIYGNGEGTTRSDPETSLSKNLYQDMSVDGGEAVTLKMNNTLLTNTTGAKRVMLDLTAGTHTISLTSKQDGELLHDLLVVKYKGEYGKDIVFDKTYEAEDADFNELIGNEATTVTTADDGETTYVTGLSEKRVTDGGGIRQSVVVRESGMYQLTFSYRSGSDGNINVYVGNNAEELSNLITAAPVTAGEGWATTGAAVYLEKGINIIDVDADTALDLDSMRVSETAAESVTIQAEDCIPSGADALFTTVQSDGAENGTYLAGIPGGDTAKGSGSGINAEVSMSRVSELTDPAEKQWSLEASRNADGTITAEIGNGTDSAGIAALYAAAYAADGSLSELKREDIALGAGESAEKTLQPQGGETVKMFLWDAEQRPLTEAVEPTAAAETADARTGETADVDLFELTVKLTNTTDEEMTVKPTAELLNAEYAEYSNPDKEYPNEDTLLSSDSGTVALGAGETKELTLYLDAATLKKPEGYIENEPQPNEGYTGPFRITSDEFFYEIKVKVEDENGSALLDEIDATHASLTSAKTTAGQYIEFKYNAPADGKYALRIFHSNDELCGEHPYNTKIIDRYMNIAVSDKDGNEISDDRYFFINTYSRDTFKEKTVTLELKEGENTIRIYNDDSVSRWYGGDVAMPSQHRAKNYTPNLDRFVIMPVSGTYDAAAVPEGGSPDLSVPVSDYNAEYRDEYIANAGFGTGDTAGWTAENVTVEKSAANNYEGFHAALTAGSALSQSVNGAELTGDGYLSVYAKGEGIEGTAYLVLSDGETVQRKALSLGDEYEATVVHHTFAGNDIEVSLDLSELTAGTIYADSFRLALSERSDSNVDVNTEYFVDCGDHFPDSLCSGDRFGKRNGVTDQIYGVDETTGYKWGVYVTDEDPEFDGENVVGASEGAWTKYQYLTTWPIEEQASKEDSYRYTFSEQTSENGFTGKKYIRYMFELDPGTYNITIGQQAMWWQGGPFELVINGEKVDTYSISSSDQWVTTVYNERRSLFTVPEGTNDVLVSLESDSDIWVTHMIISSADSEANSTLELFRDDFSTDTSADYELLNGKSVTCEWGGLDVTMNNDWNDGNGIRRDITEYVTDYSGSEFAVSLDAGYYAEGTVNASFEVCGSDGTVKETIPAASAISTADGTRVTVSGSAAVSFDDGDRVYLKVTHPAGFHSYDNIVVSVMNISKVGSEAELRAAYDKGGNYILDNDVIVVENSGTDRDDAITEGSINGGGNTLLKGTTMPRGAMLFHNNSAVWTYSNMTIDGNKDNITHTDACIWNNGADVTFENVNICNFKTSAAERMAITNVVGTITLDNAQFYGNENTGDNSEKFGEFTDIYQASWGTSGLRFEGSTSVKVYYVSGSLDVSGLGSGCNVSVKADTAEGYEYLKSLEYDGAAVSAVYDDEAMTAVFTGTAAAA